MTADLDLGPILVPLDGSGLAETALSRAAGLARATSARIVLLRAVEAHTLPGLDQTQAQLAVVGQAEHYLAEAAARLREEGVAAVEAAVWYGPASWAIVEAARLYGIGLVVMTTHGRSGFGRLILGSVAESVVRGTRTPVLLLRAPDAPVEAPALPGPTHGKPQPGPVPSARLPEGGR